MLARLLGLLSVLPSRLGSGPNDRRLIPDVDSLGTCFVTEGVSSGGGGGGGTEELLTELPPVLFLLLIVTLGGIEGFAVETVRGDARGGVCTGAGSFDLAECTRCSNRCICAVRLRMCVSDVEFGNPRVAGALVLVWRMTAGVAFLALEEDVGAMGPFELRRLPVV